MSWGHHANASKTRYIGFCPVCERYIKCQHERGRYALVHHGYERPGKGYIVGDCFGVGREPHEVSPQLARDYVAALGRTLAELQRSVVELPRISQLTFLDFRRETHTITPEDSRWPRRFKEHERELEFQIKEVKFRLQRAQRHVETWQSLPLKTVEEELEQVARQKLERTTQVASEREQKRADTISRAQARIDSAVRNQNLNALANIYESLSDTYREKLKLGTKQKVLETIDRPHVWRALGLMRGEEYLFPVWNPTARDPVKTLLGRMSGYGEPVPWPPELGEPKQRRHKPNMTQDEFEENADPGARTLVAGSHVLLRGRVLSDRHTQLEEITPRGRRVWRVVRTEELQRHVAEWAEKEGIDLSQYEANASYYVWVLGGDGLPLQSEGPHGPHDLQSAKTFARIGATEGRHDRAVSRGRDPQAPSFELVRLYRAGSGQRAL